MRGRGPLGPINRMGLEMSDPVECPDLFKFTDGNLSMAVLLRSIQGW